MKYFITLSLLLTSLFSWSQSSVVVTGEFMHMIEDDFDRGVSRDIYQLQEEKTSKMIELKFKEDKANKERPKIFRLQIKFGLLVRRIKMSYT
jgi:hypothetical protein